MDRLLDDETGTRRAHLTRVQEDGRGGVVDSRIKIRIGKNDVGVLTAQFEGNLLNCASGCCHDASAGDRTAGKRDHVYIRVIGQWRTRFGARTENEIGHAIRKTSLREHLHQVDGRVRS